MKYRNRREAGAALAENLLQFTQQPDAVVLGLVRGGVPVAAEVAARLRLPLDILVVRKLGVPWAPELAFGAIGSGGVVVHNPELEGRVPADEMAEVTARATDELRRREELYRGGHAPLDLTGKLALIVDDGLATGSTARAAVAVARRMHASRVVVAVPVGAEEAVNLLTTEADEVICPLAPAAFGSVSAYYYSFTQTTDTEVTELLAASRPAQADPDQVDPD